VADEDISINYTPFGFSDWQTEVSKIKAFGLAGKKTAVVSTINGDGGLSLGVPPSRSRCPRPCARREWREQPR
jgi:Periplasmic binding protein domain